MSEPIQRQIIELNQQVSQLCQQHQYEQAIDIATQVRDLIRDAAGEDNPVFVESLSSLAQLYRAAGNSAQAESLYQQALVIQRGMLDPNDPGLVSTLARLAAVDQAMGRFKEAVDCWQQVVTIRRVNPGADDPAYARSLMNLAGLHEAMGNYNAAEPLFVQARDVLREVVGEQNPEYALSLNNLAGLYDTLGDYVAAEPLFQQARDIWRTTLGEHHPRYAASLDNLAALYYKQGRYDSAEQHCRQALRIWEETTGEQSLDFVTTLSNLATICWDAGIFNEAEQCGKQACEIYATIAGLSHPLYATSLGNLGLIQMEMGRYEDALSELERALVIRQSTLGSGHPDVANSLWNLAILKVALHLPAEALHLLEQANEISQTLLQQVFSMSSDRRRMAHLAPIRGSFSGYLSLVLDSLPDNASAAFEHVLRRKAIGLEALAAQRDTVLGGRYPELASQLRELTSLRAQIAQQTLDGPGSEATASYETRLADWRAQAEALEADLARQVPEMTLARELRSADRQAVARALPEEAALVEFVRFDDFDFTAVPGRGERRWKPARYVAFILLAGGPDRVQMIDLGEAHTIDSLITSFRAAAAGQIEDRGVARPSVASGIADQEVPGRMATDARSALLDAVRELGAEPEGTEAPLPEVLSAGAALRAAVFDPLVPALGGRTRLFLAPDGDLSRLPFEVLPLEDRRHVIDVYHISYLSVGRDLLRFDAKPTAQSAPPVIAADPAFSLAGADSGKAVAGLFPRLAGTRVEGEQIAGRLGVTPLLEGAVLEGTIKACRSPRILHLVAGWSSRGFKRAGAGDVGEERGQLGRWSGARPALPVPLQPCPRAQPRPHPAQRDVPDDPPHGRGAVFSPQPPGREGPGRRTA